MLSIPSFIRPVFGHCDTVWNCCYEKNTSSIERLQRRAAIIICKSESVASIRWSTLQCRREDHVCNLVKKCIADRFRNYILFTRAYIAKISVASPIVINMPTSELLAGETKKSFV